MLCLVCKKEISDGRKNSLYCSSSCRRKAGNIRSKEYRKKNPDKVKAQDTLNNHIDIDKRPKACSTCGSIPSYSVHGHHNDYSKPFDVIWVCPKCHARIHKELGGLFVHAPGKGSNDRTVLCLRKGCEFESYYNGYCMNHWREADDEKAQDDGA